MGKKKALTPRVGILPLPTRSSRARGEEEELARTQRFNPGLRTTLLPFSRAVGRRGWGLRAGWRDRVQRAEQ